MASPKLALSGNPAADKLLSTDPLALLIGLVLDQQIPLERAFSSPLDLKERLGGRLDAGEIAAYDPDRLATIFSARPALHRFPAANARRVQELCRIIVDSYNGKAADIWKKAADGADLYQRVKALPGFGEQKARIFIGLLGKQLGVQPPGWDTAAGKFGQPGTFLSIADIVDEESLGRVRAYKQEMKAAAKAAAATSPRPGEMIVRANGNAIELPDDSGLLDLFDAMGVGPKWVVAEINGEAVARPDMPQVRLSDGDRIELVRAVAGG